MNPQPASPWLQKIIELGLIWARAYRQSIQQGREEEFRVLVRDFKTPREILSWVHEALVLSGDLVDLRQAPEATKNEFWAEAKDWDPGRPVRETTQLARSIYVLAYLVHNRL